MDETKTLDPITVQVVRNALISAANEMTETVIRTALNPGLSEMLDFSADLYNAEGDLIAEGKGAVMFMGTVSFGIKNVIEHVGRENINEGDVFVAAYSYFAGSHHPDVLVFKPIFLDGELFGHAAVKAHWLGITPSFGYGGPFTNMFQEGLILPGIKLVKKGVLDQEIVDIICYNSAFPEIAVGDMTAVLAACDAGERGLLALAEKYGGETLAEAITTTLDNDERTMRRIIADDIPDGEYYAEGGFDDNGIGDEPLKVCMTVTVKGDQMTFDTSGSSPQQQAPKNCPYPSTVAVCRLVAKMLLDPHTRATEGHWRPVTVTAPEGSMYNPLPPTPSMLYGWTAGPLGECIFKALSEAIPDKIVARSGGDICGAPIFEAVNPRDGRPFMCIPGQGPVGHGASIEGDGGDAIIFFCMSGSESIPIEIVEEKYPVLIEKWGLRQDSGGAGKFRGGLGVQRRVKALTDGLVSGVVEQSKFPPWGLFGGKSGLANAQALWPGTEREDTSAKFGDVPFKTDEQHDLYTGGGGGWGDPHERDVDAVLTDVVKGYVSLDNARKDYGVAIREDDGEYTLDEAATKELRGN